MASIMKSCRCGNVSLLDNQMVKVEFPTLLVRTSGEEGRKIVTCANCNVSTHVEAPDGRAVWLCEDGVSREKKSVVFGVVVPVSESQLLRKPVLGRDPKVDRLLQNYVSQIKEEARAKIERAEMEARALLIRIAAVEKKNGPLVVSDKNRDTFGDSLSLASSSSSSSAASSLSKSVPTKSFVNQNSLWALDEELNASEMSDTPMAESPFPKQEDDDDEVELLQSSDPFLPGF
jgi:hypothetical protein